MEFLLKLHGEFRWLVGLAALAVLLTAAIGVGA